jgi:hypothetical protein
MILQEIKEETLCLKMFMANFRIKRKPLAEERNKLKLPVTGEIKISGRSRNNRKAGTDKVRPIQVMASLNCMDREKPVKVPVSGIAKVVSNPMVDKARDNGIKVVTDNARDSRAKAWEVSGIKEVNKIRVDNGIKAVAKPRACTDKADRIIQADHQVSAASLEGRVKASGIKIGLKTMVAKASSAVSMARPDIAKAEMTGEDMNLLNNLEEDVQVNSVHKVRVSATSVRNHKAVPDSDKEAGENRINMANATLAEAEKKEETMAALNLAKVDGESATNMVKDHMEKAAAHKPMAEEKMTKATTAEAPAADNMAVRITDTDRSVRAMEATGAKAALTTEAAARDSENTAAAAAEKANALEAVSGMSVPAEMAEAEMEEKNSAAAAARAEMKTRNQARQEAGVLHALKETGTKITARALLLRGEKRDNN